MGITHHFILVKDLHNDHRRVPLHLFFDAVHDDFVCDQQFIPRWAQRFIDNLDKKYVSSRCMYYNYLFIIVYSQYILHMKAW